MQASSTRGFTLIEVMVTVAVVAILTSAGARATPAHPKGSNNTCWMLRGGSQCDS